MDYGGRVRLIPNGVEGLGGDSSGYIVRLFEVFASAKIDQETMGIGRVDSHFRPRRNRLRGGCLEQLLRSRRFPFV